MKKKLKKLVLVKETLLKMEELKSAQGGFGDNETVFGCDTK